MTKTLLTMMALAGSLLIPNVNAQKLEKDNRKPHEQVQIYLDSNGLAKQEFKVDHYLFKDSNGVLYYNKKYNFGGIPFIEQYGIIEDINLSRGGKSFILSPYPSLFSLDGIWYLNPFIDGFNGNEVKASDYGKSLKLKELDIEKARSKLRKVIIECPIEKKGLCA